MIQDQINFCRTNLPSFLTPKKAFQNRADGGGQEIATTALLQIFMRNCRRA
jgi:hypothetical protein